MVKSMLKNSTIANPQILIAASQDEIATQVFLNLKEEFTVLMTEKYSDLLKAPFINASIALVDGNFGKSRGLEALKSIKRVAPGMPVIFMTSKGSEKLCMNAYRLGARDYFSAPFRMEDLQDSISNILRFLDDSEKVKALEKLNNSVEMKCSRPQNGNNKYMYHKIEKARVFIDENFNKEISLETVAGAASMSKCHFSRSFKEVMGMTFTAYLSSIRLREAKRFLEHSPFTINEISYAVGYNHHSYFVKAFSRVEGCPPSIYRKKFLSF